MADVYFKCVCEKSLSAPESAAGREVPCPDCGRPLRIPPPQVYWSCECGEQMAAPASMAGASVQCSACQQLHMVPARLGLKLNKPTEAPDAVARGPAARPFQNRCPECGSGINPNHARCTHCGAWLRKGPLLVRRCLKLAAAILAVALGWFFASDLARWADMAKTFVVSRMGTPAGVQPTPPAVADVPATPPGEPASPEPGDSMGGVGDIAARANDYQPLMVQRLNMLYPPVKTGESVRIRLCSGLVLRGEVGAVGPNRVSLLSDGHATNVMFSSMDLIHRLRMDAGLRDFWTTIQASVVARSELKTNRVSVQVYDGGQPADVESAVKAGDPAALCRQGEDFLKGVGRDKDYGYALICFRASAEQGFPLGQYCLGRMYYSGLGITRDEAEGRQWLEMATSNRCELAVTFLRQAAQNESPAQSDGVSWPSDLSASQKAASAAPSPAQGGRR